MTLLEAYNMPFAAAFLLMFLLAFAQVIGLGDMLGDGDADLDADFEADFDGEGAGKGGMIGGLSSLLGLGRVPLMAWLAVYLFAFAAGGVGLQALASEFTGSPLERWLAALIMAGLAAPVTGALVRPLGAILPGDRTTAVSLDTLVGRTATITDGVARQGSPARARAIDVHGQPHFVMVEPAETGEAFEAGTEVLLTARTSNHFEASARDVPAVASH